MGQLVSFDNLKEPQELIKSRCTFVSFGNEKTIPSTIVAFVGFQIESYAKTVQPVKVVNDTIKIKEHALEENKPYAFQYNNKDYIITKTADSTKLYELRD